MRYVSKTLFAAVSPTATQTSQTIDASQITQASFMGILTGTATGTLNAQISNDPTTAVNWVTVASLAITLANPGVILLTDCAYRWIRCTWATGSGGTGTLTVSLEGEGM